MRNIDAAGMGIGDDHPPRIMGVLNISQESPYDPSVFADPGEAARYVDQQLIDEGADIVDVGLESANKKFDVLSPEQELQRLNTAIETMESTSGDAVWSIETRYHQVAEKALSRGYQMVNDICGFADPELPRVCEEHDVAVGKMASPPDLERPGAIADVDEIYDALSMNGFTEKTILDPAFGGWSEDKTVADDRETFHRLREFRGYGRPLLVSINRKNFLRSVAGRDTEGALSVSLAATAMAVERGAHVIRTHDVSETRDAALIGAEFSRDRASVAGDIGVEELAVASPAEARRHLDRLGANTEIASAAGVGVFELSGLASAELETLRASSNTTQGTVVGSAGNPSDETQSAAGIVIGTPEALQQLATDAAGFSEVLDDALGSIETALE